MPLVLVRRFSGMGRYEAVQGRRVWVDLEDGDTAGCGGELVGALDQAEPANIGTPHGTSRGKARMAA